MSDGSQLEEKDFIQESYNKDPQGTWWLIAFAALTFLTAISIWTLGAYRQGVLNQRQQSSPFYQVTNRQLSLFLYPHSTYMRVHQRSKSNYLPGFDYQNRVGITEGFADKLAIAPPALLHHYHTWQRLLGSHHSARAISVDDFSAFLEENPEWLPDNWPDAPSSYPSLIVKILARQIQSLDKLPLAVKQAFTGWKNYFHEGEEINALDVSKETIQLFLKEHPHFERHYWRNFYLADDESSLYLNKLDSSETSSILPNEQIPPFLKVAIFNWLQRPGLPP